MKKSSTRFLIAALIVAVLAYIFLYKSREKFEDDDYEGFASMVKSCKKSCRSKGLRKDRLKGCISKCQFLSQQLKNDRVYWKEWQCGTLKAGPKCADIKNRLIDFSKMYYRFPM